MDQPCYKCGQTVEEGRVFCPHCRSPQIRVVVAEAVAVPAGSPVPQSQLSTSETVPVIALPASWSQAAQPCAVAALIASLGMVSGLINPVVAALGAGFLAVALYRRRNPEITMHARTGARLGAICGVFCSGMTGILYALRVAILQEGGEIRTALLKAVEIQAVRYTDPKYEASLALLRSPAGLLLMLVFSLLVSMIILILLGMLGGALGGASLGHRDRS